MFNSDIFTEYAKRMITEGFVKEAEEKSEKQDLEKLKNLYDVRPNDEDEDKNIIEIAHPDIAIVGRAYDAFNAVVENEQQRHDMMTWIALKMPDGHLTHQRYVKYKSDLMNSLVQVAFRADSENEENLMKMADECINNLYKKANPLALLGYAGIAAALGYFGWSMYGGVSVQNVYANAKLLLEQLDDVADKSYAPYIIKTANKLMRDAMDFNDISTRIMSNSLSSVDDLIKKVTNEVSQKDLQRLDEIEKIWDKFLEIYPIYVRAIESSIHVGDTGESESSDWWQKIKDIGQTIIPGLNDEKQVIEYLTGLKDAVVEAKKQAQQLKMMGKGKAEQLKPQIEESLKKEDNTELPVLGDFIKGLEDNVPK